MDSKAPVEMLSIVMASSPVRPSKARRFEVDHLADCAALNSNQSRDALSADYVSFRLVT